MAGPDQHSNSSTRLSTLEAAVLGTIAREQPITAYEARILFAKSLTEAWSASPGAVYPAIHRMKKRRLLSGRDRDRGRGQALSVTALGRARLAKWVCSEDGVHAGVSYDPVRTRLQFLHLIPPEERMPALAALELGQLAKRALALDEAKQDEDTPYIRMAAKFLVDVIDARLRLIRRMKSEVANDTSIRTSLHREGV